jgi:hypothetical protein
MIKSSKCCKYLQEILAFTGICSPLLHFPISSFALKLDPTQDFAEVILQFCEKMKLLTNLLVLSRDPSKFAEIFIAPAKFIIFERLPRYLPVLLMQMGIVLTGVLLAVSGRLEPTISADAISITKIMDIFWVVVAAALFVLISFIVALVLVLVIGPKNGHTLVPPEQAKECFIAARRKWPWVIGPIMAEERRHNNKAITPGTKVEREMAETITKKIYEYKAVDDGEIRLLKIAWSTQNDRFDVEFVHVSLAACKIGYLAISYAWIDGDIGAKPSKVFFDEDTFLNISGPVNTIIRTLLRPGECIHLWIDSICIDQNNNDEKGLQVMLMRKIYLQAQQVVISLGQADSFTDQAMDFIVPLQDALISISRPSFGTALASGMEVFRYLRAGIDMSPAPWSALNALFNRNWWNRTWVIQEAALGSEPIFICGDRGVEWEVMVQVMKGIFLNGVLARMFSTNSKDPKVPTAKPIVAATNLHQMALARVKVQTNTLSSFQETLVDMAGFGVTDDRDRVYGMLGISREEDREKLKPDYNASVREVYIDTARRLLGRKDSILILHRAGLGNSERLGLPSWVPDWSSLETTTTLAFGRGWAKYNASGPHTPQIGTGDDEILVIDGVIVDVICEFSKLTSDHARELANSKMLYSSSTLVTGSGREHVLDLEDERKITTECVFEHQRLMFGEHFSSAIGTHCALKSAYERTVMAKSPLDSSNYHTTSPEFGRIWAKAMSSPGKAAMIQYPSKYNHQAAEESTTFHRLFKTANENRRFFTTEAKRIGLGSAEVQNGDLVVVFLGGSTPFIVRKEQTEVGDRVRDWRGYTQLGKCKLVGEAYVDGLMGGEGVAELRGQDERIVKFRLA